MWISRKLEEIHQELDLLAGQGKTVGFLANTETEQKISGLVEDIREVMMDYQVRVLTHPFLLSFLTNAPDLVATGYLRQDLSAHCGSHPPPPLFLWLTDS
jgi:hypothetical protein